MAVLKEDPERVGLDVPGAGFYIPPILYAAGRGAMEASRQIEGVFNDVIRERAQTARQNAQDYAMSVEVKRDEQGNLIKPGLPEGGGPIYNEAYREAIAMRYVKQAQTDFEVGADEIITKLGAKAYVDPTEPARLLNEWLKQSVSRVDPQYRGALGTAFQGLVQNRIQAVANRASANAHGNVVQWQTKTLGKLQEDAETAATGGDLEAVKTLSMEYAAMLENAVKTRTIDPGMVDVLRSDMRNRIVAGSVVHMTKAMNVEDIDKLGQIVQQNNLDATVTMSDGSTLEARDVLEGLTDVNTRMRVSSILNQIASNQSGAERKRVEAETMNAYLREVWATAQGKRNGQPLPLGVGLTEAKRQAGIDMVADRINMEDPAAGAETAMLISGSGIVPRQIENSIASLTSLSPKRQEHLLAMWKAIKTNPNIGYGMGTGAFKPEHAARLDTLEMARNLNVPIAQANPLKTFDAAFDFTGMPGKSSEHADTLVKKAINKIGGAGGITTMGLREEILRVWTLRASFGNKHGSVSAIDDFAIKYVADKYTMHDKVVNIGGSKVPIPKSAVQYMGDSEREKWLNGFIADHKQWFEPMKDGRGDPVKLPELIEKGDYKITPLNAPGTDNIFQVLIRTRSDEGGFYEPVIDSRTGRPLEIQPDPVRRTYDVSRSMQEEEYNRARGVDNAENKAMIRWGINPEKPFPDKTLANPVGAKAGITAAATVAAQVKEWGRSLRAFGAGTSTGPTVGYTGFFSAFSGAPRGTKNPNEVGLDPTKGGPAVARSILGRIEEVIPQGNVPLFMAIAELEGGFNPTPNHPDRYDRGMFGINFKQGYFNEVKQRLENGDATVVALDNRIKDAFGWSLGQMEPGDLSKPLVAALFARVGAATRPPIPADAEGQARWYTRYYWGKERTDANAEQWDKWYQTALGAITRHRRDAGIQ